MVMDATISTNNPPYDYMQIQGGLYSWLGAYDRTNHVRKSIDPIGSNICYADGHVDWRGFDEMEIRLDQNPKHWW